MRRVVMYSGIALTVFVSVVALPARAQDVITPNPEESLKQHYLDLLSDYRTKDQQFLVAYQQYVQLQTLASQEIMVQKAKDAMLARAETLDNYLLLLSQVLGGTKGVELSRLSDEQQQIQVQRTAIQEHMARTQSMTDRLELDTESTAFQKTQTDIRSIAYRAMTLIKIAQLQNSVDQLQAPISMITQSLENSDLQQTKIEEKKRGLTEIGRQLEQVNTSLLAAIDEYDSSAKSRAFTSDDYNTIINILGSGYAKTQLVLSYVQELAK